MFKPKLSDYDVNVLIILLQNDVDDNYRNEVKGIIIKKILNYGYPLFYLIHKFKCSKGILKELYADIILRKVQVDDLDVDLKIIDEILSFASLDALIYYGANSMSMELNNRCKEEFYKRGDKIEDKKELAKKRGIRKYKKIISCVKES